MYITSRRGLESTKETHSQSPSLPHHGENICRASGGPGRIQAVTLVWKPWTGDRISTLKPATLEGAIAFGQSFGNRCQHGYARSRLIGQCIIFTFSVGSAQRKRMESFVRMTSLGRRRVEEGGMFAEDFSSQSLPHAPDLHQPSDRASSVRTPLGNLRLPRGGQRRWPT